MASCRESPCDSASCRDSRQEAKSHGQSLQEAIYQAQQYRQEARDRGQARRKPNMMDSLCRKRKLADSFIPCVDVLNISEDLGKEVENSLNEAELPGKVLYVRCDVTKEDDIKTLIQTTVDKFGRIDCLINNVGFNPGPRLLSTCSVEDFRWLLDLNLVTPFHVSKYAIKHLRETKGNIINMASMAGVLGQGDTMPYTAAKAGIIGLTKAMAVDESKHGVRINCVSPGAVETPLLKQYFTDLPNSQKVSDYFTKHVNYMGRLCQPEEVARACLYLATDATYSTGNNLLVSGGYELDYGFKANMEFFFEK